MMHIFSSLSHSPLNQAKDGQLWVPLVGVCIIITTTQDKQHGTYKTHMQHDDDVIVTSSLTRLAHTHSNQLCYDYAVLISSFPYYFYYVTFRCVVMIAFIKTVLALRNSSHVPRVLSCVLMRGYTTTVSVKHSRLIAYFVTASSLSNNIVYTKRSRGLFQL